MKQEIVICELPCLPTGREFRFTIKKIELLIVIFFFLYLLSTVHFAVKKIMAKLKLDLHEICKKGKLIEKELNRVIDEATEKRIALVEIIPGKGSGQLKKTVLRFLERPDRKKRYHRINKDSKNFGRVFVHFRH